MDNILPGNENLSALVDELDELYPLFTPSPKDEDRLIMYRAGQRSVVDYILSKMTHERI
jgi:hypothetical protein